MEHKQQMASSTSPAETQMERPPIYTTEDGSQYVRVVDIIRSKLGWAEIQRLKEASLVRPRPTDCHTDSNCSSEE